MYRFTILPRFVDFPCSVHIALETLTAEAVLTELDRRMVLSPQEKWALSNATYQVYCKGNLQATYASMEDFTVCLVDMGQWHDGGKLTTRKPTPRRGLLGRKSISATSSSIMPASVLSR